MADLLVFMLQREGYEAQVAPDGKEAERFIESKGPPAIVLMDTMLPYKDGIQLLGQIRKTEAWRQVPVIMLTAKSGESDVVRALDTGANDYIVKPFKPKELIARIRRFLPAAK